MNKKIGLVLCGLASLLLSASAGAAVATYYHDTITGIAIGVDGPTNVTSGTNQVIPPIITASLTVANTCTGNARSNNHPAGLFTHSRWYLTTNYAVATNISANPVGVAVIRGVATTDSTIVSLYDYDPVTGVKTLIGSSPVIVLTNGASTSAYPYTISSPLYTVPAGHRLMLEYSFNQLAATNNARVYCFVKPANYSYIAVTETTAAVPALAEYRMDEASWNGTAGEVLDSSGNGNNAQALNSASIAAITPAIAGNPGTCGYGVFDNGTTITQGYVQTPLPDLTTNFTVTAWIRTTNNTIAGQRILIDDQGAAPATGYGISLGDGATGILRFYSRGITPIILDSTYTIANNTWYFVAAVADIANKKRTIYVYNATGTLLNTTTEAAWTAGAWGTDGGPVSIGAETNASAEPPATYHFRGNLDEVAVYNGALTIAQLTAISTKTHACQFGLGHVAISAPANDMAFTPALVTIAPHDAAHAAISNAGTISLSTSTNSGDWTVGSGTGILTPGAANSGLATYTFGPGETVASLNFTYQTAGTVILYVRDAAGVDLLMNTPVGEKANTITFTVPGYVFTSSACTDGVAFGTAGQCAKVVWSPQIAGQVFSNIYITAVNAAGVPTRLSRTKATNVSMQYGLSCHNPLAGAGMVPTFTATTNIFPACKPSGAMPTVWTTGINITFPAGIPSSGPFSFNYPDVGMVELWMQKTGTTSTGSSGAFVVKPGGFVLSAIQQTAVPNLPNPAAANAAGAKFVKAGEAFSVTVTATTCAPASATCTVAGAATPNYGKENVPENVKLTPANVIAGMVTPVPKIGGTFAAFASGVATGTAFTWDEVGIITLTPSVIDGNYLGAGDTTGTASNVGRFYPDHFDTAVVATATVPMPCPTGLTCPAFYNGFVYSGQPFSLTVTAKNVAGATTANYNATTGFAKTANLAAWGALGATTAPAGAGTLGVASVTAFAAGTLTEAAEKYTFTAIPTAPADIYLRATDSDAVTSQRTIPASSVEGGVKVVSGSIKVGNVYGSELLPLNMTATVQYYNGNGWVASSTDSVTPFNVGAIVPAIVTGSLVAGNLAATVVSDACVDTVFCGGIKQFTLTNTAHAGGSASICLNLPAYLQGMPACAAGTPGPNAGLATFGIYLGNPVFIYRGRHGR